MTYAIVCDARRGHNLGIDILMLVDRSRCKSLWWTSDDPRIAINYRDLNAAQFACKRLRRNRARVVMFDDAARVLRRQARDIFAVEVERLADDPSWDSHKS